MSPVLRADEFSRIRLPSYHTDQFRHMEMLIFRAVASLAAATAPKAAFFSTDQRFMA